MSRVITVGSAQLGAISRNDSRAKVVKRMIELLREAKSKNCKAVVFPELALTTFFPRWFFEDLSEVEQYFEKDMPNADVQPLFDEAARLGIGFFLGFAELAEEDGKVKRYNASVLVDERGQIAGKYRKVHLPGHYKHNPDLEWQHLEKGYFEPGNLGFPVFRAFGGIMGMCLCNDRRWPETFRVMGLQGVELVMLGYNTPSYDFGGNEPEHLKQFHNRLAVQAGAYQNGTWVVSTAKAGNEDGAHLIGGSLIVSPAGEIVAQASTLEDELITYDCDLNLGMYIKEGIFNFEKHRRIDCYELISTQRGVVVPKELRVQEQTS